METYLRGRTIVDEANGDKNGKDRIEKLNNALICFEDLAKKSPNSNACNKVLAVGSDPYTIFSVKAQIENIKASFPSPISVSASNPTPIQIESNLSSSSSLIINPQQVSPSGTPIVQIMQPEAVPEPTPSISSETQIGIVISEKLESGKLTLPTIKDAADYASSPDEKKEYEGLSSLSPKERISKEIAGFSKDFAVKSVDFNEDGTKDVFVEVKEGENKFALYFFDGAKETFEPIQFAWEIQGSLGSPTKYKDSAYFLSFDDKDNQVLFCYCGDYNMAWLGFVEGKVKNVSVVIADLEGGVEEVECDNDWSCTLESLTPKWAYVNMKYKEKEELMILPKKKFQSLGFIWGNDVNVRSGYGPDYKNKKVLYQFQNGAVVDIVEERDGWVRVIPPVYPCKFCPSGFDSYQEPQWVKADFVKNVPPPKREKKPDSPQKGQPTSLNPQTISTPALSTISESDLADLNMLWSMPSSFLGQKVNCFFHIHEIHEESDHYSIMVSDGKNLFDMKNPMAFSVKISKGDDSFVRNIVKLKGQKAILSGYVKKSDDLLNIHYLDVTNARYKTSD